MVEEIDGGDIGNATLERKRFFNMGPIREYDAPSIFLNNGDDNSGGVNITTIPVTRTREPLVW